LIWYAVAGLFRSHAALQTEVLALRHQLNVLRCRAPNRVPALRIGAPGYRQQYRSPRVCGALAPRARLSGRQPKPLTLAWFAREERPGNTNILGAGSRPPR
jgi:hypothetical protein